MQTMESWNKCKKNLWSCQVAFTVSKSNMFNFDHATLEIVDTYTYLGITFSKTGEFETAIKGLSERVWKHFLAFRAH